MKVIRFSKGGFFQISKIKIFQITILSLKFEFVVSVIGVKFKFQVQDSDLEYFFWRFGFLKNTWHFLKKANFTYCLPTYIFIIS